MKICSVSLIREMSIIATVTCHRGSEIERCISISFMTKFYHSGYGYLVCIFVVSSEFYWMSNITHITCFKTEFSFTHSKILRQLLLLQRIQVHLTTPTEQLTILTGQLTPLTGQLTTPTGRSQHQ